MSEPTFFYLMAHIISLPCSKCPIKQTDFSQRAYNVEMTSYQRRIDVDMTSFQRCVPAGLAFACLYNDKLMLFSKWSMHYEKGIGAIF